MSEHPRGQPHKPQAIPPEQGASPASNPDGNTPNGVPEQADQHDAAGAPDSGRLKTETVPGQGG